MTGRTGIDNYFDWDRERPMTGRTDMSEDLYMVNGIMPTKYPTEKLKEDGVRPDTSRIYHMHQPNYEDLSGVELPPIKTKKKLKGRIKKKGSFEPPESIKEESRPGTGASEFARRRSDVTSHHR